MNGKELTALATAAAVYLVENHTETEALLAASFLAQVSESIKRIIFQEDLITKNFNL